MTPPGKTQEQRREDATSALEDAGYSRTRAESLVKLVLEAADAPPKPWPTDESMTALRRTGGCYMIPPLRDGPLAVDCGLHQALRDAMLADPIIKAAVDLREAYYKDATTNREVRRLIQAVDDALGSDQPH